MTDSRIVLTTAGNKDEANRIAVALVEEQLAACVNIIGPIESIYRWKGKVENAAEYLLLIKTTASVFARLRDAIQRMHSYELPECIEINIEDGSTAYLNWIGESIK